MLRFFPIISTVFAAFILFSGCTSTEVHTFRSHDFVGKYYDRVLLVVDIPDGKDRFFAERAFEQEFTARGLKLLSATSIFPSLRDMSEDKLIAILEKQDIQCIITLTPVAAAELYSRPSQRRQYYSPKLAWANNLLYYDNPNPEYPENENLYRGDLAKFSLRLYDMPSGKLSWLGVSVSEKSGLGSFESLIEHNAHETVRTLSNEKLIVPLIADK